MDKLSTGILINKIKLMDKIDCEIESASRSKRLFQGSLEYYEGKLNAFQDLKQWIGDLEKEGE